MLATNLSYRHNLRWDLEKYRQLDLLQGRAQAGAAPARCVSDDADPS